eukprot:9478278-Pyramimonas_sp.AAC.1
MLGPSLGISVPGPGGEHDVVGFVISATSDDYKNRTLYATPNMYNVRGELQIRREIDWTAWQVVLVFWMILKFRTLPSVPSYHRCQSQCLDPTVHIYE